jgi:hypothetical protein
MAASRPADCTVWNVIWSSLKPSFAATSFAISMSKPEYSPVVGSLNPRPGWSSLTPMVTPPFVCIRSNVGEPSTLTSVATAAVVSGLPPVGLSGVPSLPHAVRARPPTSSPTARVRTLILTTPTFLVRRRGRTTPRQDTSVSEDLP